MVQKLRSLTCFLLFFAGGSILFSFQTASGTSSFQFLKILDSTKASARNGIFFSEKTGIDSFYSNPAGLMGIDKFETSVACGHLYNDINYTSLFSGLRIPGKIVVAAGISYLSYGVVDLTSYDPSAGVISTGVSQPSDRNIQIACAADIADHISIAADLKMANTVLINRSDKVFSADAGMIFDLPGNLFSAGLVLQNPFLNPVLDVSIGKKITVKANHLVRMEAGTSVPGDGPVSSGISAEYCYKNTYSCRSGLCLENGTWTAGCGAGFCFVIHDIRFSMDYALCRLNTPAFRHQFSMNMAL